MPDGPRQLEQQGLIDALRIGRIGPLITGDAAAEHHPGWQGSDLLEEGRCAGSDLTPAEPIPMEPG
jgi:hypothetical protein